MIVIDKDGKSYNAVAVINRTQVSKDVMKKAGIGHDRMVEMIALNLVKELLKKRYVTIEQEAVVREYPTLDPEEETLIDAGFINVKISMVLLQPIE